MRPIDSRDMIVLSTDGSEGNYYNARSIVWSPDSTKIAIYRVRQIWFSAGGTHAGRDPYFLSFFRINFDGTGLTELTTAEANHNAMSWPIGPQYSASSNVDNAHRLQGELLLVVGEMDTNVDPSSTMQVVHRLIRANKNFDLLVVPGANHGAARGDSLLGLWRAQAIRLLRASPPRPQSATLEQRTGREFNSIRTVSFSLSMRSGFAA